MYKCPCTKLYYEIIFHTLQSTCLIIKFRSFWGFRFALSRQKACSSAISGASFRIFFCAKDTFRRLPKGWNENFSPLCLSRQPGGRISLTVRCQEFCVFDCCHFWADITTFIVYFISWTISQRSHAINNYSVSQFTVTWYRKLIHTFWIYPQER